MDYKPQDCGGVCKYPDISLPTGSGHHRQCLAHQRWESNGRTWRPPQPGDEYKHAAEAQTIVANLITIADQLDSPVEREFIERKASQLAQYRERTFVSDKEISWLRSLLEKHK